MQIQSILYITYCVLVYTTFICSFKQFFAVATENIASLSSKQSRNADGIAHTTEPPYRPELVSDVHSMTRISMPFNKNQIPSSLRGGVSKIYENEMIGTVSNKLQNLMSTTVFVHGTCQQMPYFAGMFPDLSTNSGRLEMQNHFSIDEEYETVQENGHDLSSMNSDKILTDMQDLKPQNIATHTPQTVETTIDPKNNEYYIKQIPSSATLENQQDQNNIVLKKEDSLNQNENNIISDLNVIYTKTFVHNKSVNQLNDGSETATVEVPIPVFSEWAQKQMEEQQAMEQKVFHINVSKKNQSNDDGNKGQALKLRDKNYASPDCGAKIIASNTDATNTGAVLSSSKDEYMLSPCGNRIWFVVELCEAIQARKIDVANFELFSSSPRNFTVAVSNRFPTRDWSSVGHFIAADKRKIQRFELYPHLFGKFIRVDIHSHYSKEHFCPVSLFRVFGTSEFEAFETENHSSGADDDIDDDFNEDHSDHLEKPDPNLFKSASDAVLSIVKKAAEVLVKPSIAEHNNSISELDVQNSTQICQTLVFETFNCATCLPTFVDNVNRILSCELSTLKELLRTPQVRRDLLYTRVCSEWYGLNISNNGYNAEFQHNNSFCINVKQSYYLTLLSAEYVGGLCQLLFVDQLKLFQTKNPVHKNDFHDVESNLTVEKQDALQDASQTNKLKNNFDVELTASDNISQTYNDNITNGTDALIHNITEQTSSVGTKHNENGSTITTAFSEEEYDNVIPVTKIPPVTEPLYESNTIKKVTAPDVNIFNSPSLNIDTGKEDDKESDAPQNQFTTQSTIAIDTLVPNVDSIHDAAILDTFKLKTANSNENVNDEKWANWDKFLMPTIGTTQNIIVESKTASLENNMDGYVMEKIPDSNYPKKAISSTGAQSESVFIRLSNRIKALERNMSLSGQYLEELSRRYKKQVEELQISLTQQSQTVRVLEEQRRQHVEFENLLAQRNEQLKAELDDLTLQVHACIVLIIFVGAFVFIVVMIVILFYRSMRREMKKVARMLPMQVPVPMGETNHKISRRKSFENLSNGKFYHEIFPVNANKQRRPSEEAMLILKSCKNTDTQFATQKNSSSTEATPSKQQHSTPTPCANAAHKRNNNNKANSADKKVKKNSWPQSVEQRQQQYMTLWQLQQEIKLCDRLISKGV